MAIVAAIYVHSPLRPQDGMDRQVAAWMDVAKGKIVTGAEGPAAASLLAGIALRQTLDAASGATPPQASVETAHTPARHP